MASNDTFLSPRDMVVPPPRRRPWYGKWWGIIIVLFLLLFLAIIVAFGFQVLGFAHSLRNDQPPVARQQFDMSTLISPDDPTVGPRDAKVVIVEFSDFQCPFCGQAFPVVKELISRYGDDVLFVFKDFPLIDIHPQAAIAALAGQCAAEQGKFWQLHDLMFQNQDNLLEADLRRYAIQAGLNSIQFGSCLQSAKYLERVQQDFDLGVNLKVNSTPTFIVNGVVIRGAAPISEFEKIIIPALNQ